jgi:hypothetical protein
MAKVRVIAAVLIVYSYTIPAHAQNVSVPPLDSNPEPAHWATTAPNPIASQTVPLTVPKGTAVQVVLDKEVRIQKIGQSIHGRIAEPLYAFDKLVVPVGTEVAGRITQLKNVSTGKRTLDALNAEFTPPRKVKIEFDDLRFGDGRHVPIHTAVKLGSGEVIRFVTGSDSSKKKGVAAAASDKASQAKEEAKRQWNDAMKQVHEPGRLHRLRRYAVAQLPIHPQYIDAGTVYFAELEQPLDFGTETLAPDVAASMNKAPPPGASVHARLITELSSATAQKGDAVEAVLSQPLFDGDHLVLPQGSLLRGSVLQVQPARRLSRNGQLRIAFNELVLPDGIGQKVEATLRGVQADKGQNVKLDSEGGAEANSPKTRYLTSGISLGLAFISARGDPDARNGDVNGNTNSRVAGGAGGFKLVGIVLGAFVHS